MAVLRSKPVTVTPRAAHRFGYMAALQIRTGTLEHGPVGSLCPFNGQLRAAWLAGYKLGRKS